MKLPPFLREGVLARTLTTFRDEFLAVAVFSLVVNLLLLTPTLYMLQIYDRAMVSQNTMTLWAVSLLALFFFLVMAFAEWMRTKLLIRAGVRFDDLLNRRVFDAAFAASLGHDGREPRQAFTDLNAIRQFLTGNGIFTLFDLPWTPIYLLVAWLLHPWIGLLALGCVLLSAALAWAGQRHLRPGNEAALQAQQKVANYAQEKLYHAEIVEAMGMLDALRERWQQLRHAASQTQDAAADRAQRLQALGKFVRYTQQSLMLAAGAILVIRGEMTVGGMIAANVLLARALHPVEQLVGNGRSFLAAGLAFSRLETLLAGHQERTGDSPPMPLRGALRVAGLTAGAPGRATPILRGIDAELPAGRLVLIVGPSGCGKSTLARCLLGIWPQRSGEVWLDGTPIEDWPRSALGPQVGYLPQDVELLDGTIAENIARFGEVDAEKVIAAARQAGVHEMVLRLPRGYDTPTGEAGQLLSAGQRQRLALARALYGSPPLLVLDEPNSNLDEAGEAALHRVLRELRAAGRSIFLISHRMLELDSVDQVLVLADGRLRPPVARPAPASQAQPASGPAAALQNA